MANERAQALHAAQNLFKIPELKSKILFTLLCLAIYRLGSHIPTAGVNVLALQQLAGQFQGTLFGIYDLFWSPYTWLRNHTFGLHLGGY